LQKWKKSKGGILIEFAVSVPVLIAIIYYGYDLPKYARINEKMKFCAYCAANMLQNMTQNRENKRITRADIMQIAHAAWLPFYGGGIMQYSTKAPTTARTYWMPLGYVSQIELYYVKGVGNGRGKLCWVINANCALGPNPVNIDIVGSRAQYSGINGSPGNTYALSSILPGLTVEENQFKMIMQLHICTLPSAVYDRSGRPISKPISSRLGLYLMTVPGERSNTFLHTNIIFTPRSGLFDETPPS